MSTDRSLVGAAPVTFGAYGRGRSLGTRSFNAIKIYISERSNSYIGGWGGSADAQFR